MNQNINQQRINVDLSNALDVTCEQCGSKVFREVLFVKKVSALVSPTGKEALVPIGTLACNGCGHINAAFVPQTAPPVAKGE